MEIKFDLTTDDYWKFNKYAMFNKQPFKRNMIINLVLLPVIVIAVCLILLPKFTDEIPATLFLVIAIIYSFIGDLLLIYLMKRRVLKMVANDNSGILGEHIIKIDENIVSERTSVNDGSFKWEAVLSIDQNNDYIFIFISVLAAHIIPKRAFESADKTTEFYNKAMEYWKAARNVTA